MARDIAGVSRRRAGGTRVSDASRGVVRGRVGGQDRVGRHPGRRVWLLLQLKKYDEERGRSVEGQAPTTGIRGLGTLNTRIIR